MSSDMPRCDLVMQGGITSGLVYPSAIIELSKRCTFQSIGGTSAGAIAAAGAAAAEYGRQSGEGGFGALESALENLQRDGVLLGLFQPVPEARRIFTAALRLVTGQAPMRSRLLRAAGHLLVTPWLVACAIGALVIVVGIAGTTAALSSAGPWVTALLIVLALTTWLAVVGAIAGWTVLRLARRLRGTLETHGYGLCPGSPQPGFAETALTPWIHERVQAAAGLRSDDAPLTFRMLEEQGHVRLRLITTDLSEGRPVTLPLPPDAGYLFDEAEMRRLLPDAMVDHLRDTGTEVTIGGRTLRTLSGPDMPITMAARLSLSFPILLSAVPLYQQEGDRLVTHLMSDGGITSNFPIHLFDEWLPGHPTFGLSLQPAGQHDTPPLVRLSDDVPPTRWPQAKGLLDFCTQVFDAARNWRDNLQAQLPNSRDRICHVYLSDREGGLNLDMPGPLRVALIERGRDAGRAFASFDWPRHWRNRHRTLMQMMQRGLHRADDSFRAHAATVLSDAELDESERRWYDEAYAATQALLATAPHLGREEHGPIFDTPDAPRPTPVMRIVPDV